MNNHLLLHLSLIPSVGPATIYTLVDRLPREQIRLLYDMSAAELSQLSGISIKTAASISTGLANKKLLDEELARIQKHAISWITRYDDAYPILLRHIPAPPVILYFKGTLPVDMKGLAVVGSRAADYYGKSAIEHLVPRLAQAGLTIVSGGARGIDALAHQAALDAGGTTVAVLGSGLLRPYPLQNKKLFETIVESGGALVSSFSLATSALPGNFPARNRIIAGLSTGCLVIQAAVKSGARITAQYALDQGRTVFAVPGPITSPLSAGCHELIQQGAYLVSDSIHIFKELGYECQAALSTKPVTPGNDIQEHPLLSLCSTPKSLEELLSQTSYSMVELMNELFELSMHGKIAQDGAGLWLRNS